MSDIILRPDIGVNQATMRYIDRTAASISPYTGDAETSELTGDRLGCTLEFSPKVAGGDRIGRSQLIAFLARLRGKRNRVFIFDTSARNNGTFPTGELLPNGMFRNGMTGWTSGGTDVNLSVSDRILRLTRTTANHTDVNVYAGPITVVSGGHYAFRAAVVGGYGGAGFKLRMGTTLGGNEIAESSVVYSDDTVATIHGVASGTTMYVSILDSGVPGLRTTTMYQEVHYASLARCLAVDSTNNSNTVTYAKGMPNYLADVAMAGDQVEFITSRGSELKILTASAQAVVGSGHLQFTPPLRGTIAVDAPIILYKPMGRFLFTGQVPEWMTNPGLITQASLDLMESK